MTKASAVTTAAATAPTVKTVSMVHLRTARPYFPWPDPDAQIDDMVDRTLGRNAPAGAVQQS